MTREDVIRMAREAEWLGGVEGWTFNSYEQLERFAQLVAAEEREACAKVCERDVGMLGRGELGEFWADKCAAAIRARGQQ